MTDNDADNVLLARASQVLRRQPEPGWDRISGVVIAAMRAAPRGGWPLTAEPPARNLPGAAPGSLSLSDLVLRGALVRRLLLRHACAPTDIEFTVDGHALRRVRIEFTGGYGTDLRPLAEQIRNTAATLVRELLGDTHPPITPDDIDIVVADIVVGDPRQA